MKRKTKNILAYSVIVSLFACFFIIVAYNFKNKNHEDSNTVAQYANTNNEQKDGSSKFNENAKSTTDAKKIFDINTNSSMNADKDYEENNEETDTTQTLTIGAGIGDYDFYEDADKPNNRYASNNFPKNEDVSIWWKIKKGVLTIQPKQEDGFYHVSKKEDGSTPKIGPGWYDKILSVKEVVIKDKICPDNTASWFSTAFEEAVYKLPKITKISGLSNIDMSKVVDASFMFSGVGYENGSVELEDNWSLTEESGSLYLDMSSVENMDGMFAETKMGNAGFPSDLEINIKTTNLSSSNCMFQACDDISIVNMENFTYGSSPEIAFMFNGATSITQIKSIPAFNVNSFLRAEAAFCSCSGITELDLIKWTGNSPGCKFNSMFNGCSKLKTIMVSPGTHWQWSSGTTFNMFRSTPILTGGLDATSSTAGIKNTAALVDGGETLEQSTPGLFTTEYKVSGAVFDTTHAKIDNDKKYTISQKAVVTEQQNGIFTIEDEAGQTQTLFSAQINSEAHPEIDFYNVEFNYWDYGATPISNQKRLISNTTCTAKFNWLLASWDAQHTNLWDNLFGSSSNGTTLTFVYVSDKEISEPASGYLIPKRPKSVDDLPYKNVISDINQVNILPSVKDYENLVSTAYWFKDFKNTGFTNADRNKLNIELSNLYTYNVDDMSNMFNGCTSLQYIDISPIDKERDSTEPAEIVINNTSSMFSNCSSLKTIATSTYTNNQFWQNAHISTNMFDGSWALVGGNGFISYKTGIDVSNTYAVGDSHDCPGFFTYNETFDDARIINYYGEKDSTTGEYPKFDFRTIVHFDETTSSQHIQYTVAGREQQALPTNPTKTFIGWAKTGGSEEPEYKHMQNVNMDYSNKDINLYSVHVGNNEAYYHVNRNSTNDGYSTLTFYYDSKRAERWNESTTINIGNGAIPENSTHTTSGELTSEVPWYKYNLQGEDGAIKDVVFDKSFKGYDSEGLTSTAYWFARASKGDICSIETITGWENFHSEHVKTVRSMFNDCYKMQTIDLSQFNMSSVNRMRNMFWMDNPTTQGGYSGVQHIIFPTDPAKVPKKLNGQQAIRGMFGNCQALIDVDMSAIPQVEEMTTNPPPETEHPYSISYYFSGSFLEDGKTYETLQDGCTNLQKVYVGENWDVTICDDEEASDGAIGTVMPKSKGVLVGGNGDTFNYENDGRSKVNAYAGNVDQAGFFTYKGDDQCRVSYDLNYSGAQAITFTQQVKQGWSITVGGAESQVSVPERTDYTFSGWNTSPTGDGIQVDGSTYETPAKSDITLYAQWATSVGVAEPEQTNTLTYNTQMQSPTWNVSSDNVRFSGDSTSATDAGTYTLQATPARGYCWSDGTTSTKTATWAINKLDLRKQATIENVSDNTEWQGTNITPTPSVTATIAQGGFDINVAYAYSQNTPATSGDYSCENTVTATATDTTNFEGTISTSYKETRKIMGQVEYFPNGGSGTISSQNKYYGVDVNLSDGYGFDPSTTGSNKGVAAWNTESSANGTSFVPTTKYSAESGIKLYAQWGPRTTKAVLSNGTYSEEGNFVFYYDAFNHGVNETNSNKEGTSYSVPDNALPTTEAECINQIPWYSNRKSITKKVSFSKSFTDYKNIQSTSYWFGSKSDTTTNCCMMTEFDGTYFDTSNVVCMQSMFSECKLLKTIDVSYFNTSNVTNMNYIFLMQNAYSSLERIYAGDKWSTSKVTLCTNPLSNNINLTAYNGTDVERYKDTYNKESYLRLYSGSTIGMLTDIKYKKP